MIQNIYGSNGIKVIPAGLNGSVIELDASVTEIIQWAKQKKDEEVELEKLAISNAAIRDLVYDLNETKNKIKMVQILLKENESVGTN